ncbi:MAG: hypothetical protein AB7O84_18415, partial [Planctomycetota bacterium]
MIALPRTANRLGPLLALLFAAAVAAQHGDRADADRCELPPELEVPPAPARTAAEQLATFRLADG